MCGVATCVPPLMLWCLMLSFLADWLQELAPTIYNRPARLRLQDDCCDAGGGGSSAVQQAGAMTCQQASSEAATTDFTQRLWALPFKQRVELCTGIFRGLEPVRQTLQEHGATVHDGFALQTE